MNKKNRMYHLGAAVVACLGLSGEALALDKCTAHWDTATGTVQVSARAISGVLAWGRVAGQETGGFTDESCLGRTKATDCTLAVSGTTDPVTHFGQCLLYLADGNDRCDAYISGCTPADRAVPLYFDDFEAGANGWSPASTSMVGSSTVLGGCCAGPYAKVLATETPHTGLRIRATAHLLDDWQGETAYLKVDGNIVWTRSRSAAGDIVNVAGNPIYPDLVGVLIDVHLPHTAPTTALEFGCAPVGGAPSCTAPLAIDDVLVSTY